MKAFVDSIPVIEFHSEISDGKSISVCVSSVPSVFSFPRDRRTRLLAAGQVKGVVSRNFVHRLQPLERGVGEQDPRKRLPTLPSE